MPKIIKSAQGDFTTANITVDASGRVITASSGAGGGDGGYVFTDGRMGGTGGAVTNTFTAQPTATGILVYAVGGGGGSGGGMSPNTQAGGNGGFGIYKTSITPPYSQPFTTGSGGAGGINYTSYTGTAGQASTFGSPTVLSAGGGSGGAPTPTGGTASSGTAPTSSIDLSIATSPSVSRSTGYRRISAFFGVEPASQPTTGKAWAGIGGAPMAPSPGPAGKAGGDGMIAIYELLP